MGVGGTTGWTTVSSVYTGEIDSFGFDHILEACSLTVYHEFSLNPFPVSKLFYGNP